MSLMNPGLASIKCQAMVFQENVDPFPPFFQVPSDPGGGVCASNCYIPVHLAVPSAHE